MPKVKVEMDDVSFTMIRNAEGKWDVILTDTSGLPISEGESHEHTFTCTDKQASAILALMVGEIEDDELLNQHLYGIANPALAGVPDRLRPIP